jgi:hypothetical protein
MNKLFHLYIGNWRFYRDQTKFVIQIWFDLDKYII